MSAGQSTAHDGSLSGGYEYPENKTAVITQSKAASSKRRKRNIKRRGNKKSFPI